MMAFVEEPNQILPDSFSTKFKNWLEEIVEDDGCK